MRKQRSTTSVTGLFFPALKSLPIAALLLLGTTACSDENIPDDNGTQGVESTITVGNDPAAQADRIFFYGNSGTRAEGDGDGLGFPEVGSEPKNLDYTKMTPLTEANMDNLSDNTNYYLASDLTTTKNLNIPANSNVYINKTLTINSDCAVFKGGGKIYIVGEGNLVVSNKLQVGESGNIVELRAYENSNIHVPGELLVNGKFLTKGVVSVGKECNVEGGSFLIAKDLSVGGKFQVKYNAKAKATCITSTYEDKQNGQEVIVEGDLVVRNHMICEHNIFVKGKVHMRPYSIVEIEGKTEIENGGQFLYSTSEGNDGRPTLLKTNTIDARCSIQDLNAMFTTSPRLVYESLVGTLMDNNNNSNSIKVNESATDYYVPKAGCHDGYNAANKPADSKNDENAKIFTEVVYAASPLSHSHDFLSATCVQPVVENNAGNVYISYHLNTEYEDNAQLENGPHMGCVEKFNLTSSGAAITSWLRNEDFDFNHMIVDGSKLYAVGDTKKYGATLGVVNLVNGDFGNYEMETENRANVMTYYNLYKKVEGNRGSSGNCLIKNGENLLFASYLGFQQGKFNANSELKMSDEAFLSTTGSAKHIATDGNYIVTLNLNAKDVKSSTATINVYTVEGFNGFNGNHTTIPTKSQVTPIDGKNVIAVNNGYIYVALGETGVEKWAVNGGSEPVAVYNYNKNVKPNDKNDKPHPRANGLDVDDKYVYVANGEGGLIVLDKETMKPVGKHVKKWSANYVRAIGDYIYIAYGRDGLVIVKMQDNTVNPADVKIEKD